MTRETVEDLQERYDAAADAAESRRLSIIELEKELREERVDCANFEDRCCHLVRERDDALAKADAQEALVQQLERDLRAARLANADLMATILVKTTERDEAREKVAELERDLCDWEILADENSAQLGTLVKARTAELDRAVAAERERCAELFDLFCDQSDGECISTHEWERAIRTGKTAEQLRAELEGGE